METNWITRFAGLNKHTRCKLKHRGKEKKLSRNHPSKAS